VTDTDRAAADVGVEESVALVDGNVEKETVAGTVVPGVMPSVAEHAAIIEHATRIFEVVERQDRMDELH
jgi:hypothetical protein